MNDVKAFELYCMRAAVLKPPEIGSLFQFRKEKKTKVGLDWVGEITNKSNINESLSISTPSNVIFYCIFIMQFQGLPFDIS